MNVEAMDNIYSITVWREEYVNPIADDILNWCNIISSSLDFEERLEN